VLSNVCLILELKAVVTFQWTLELLAKALLQVFMSFLIGERRLALLALKLVCVESVEHKPVHALSGLEVVLASGAVAIALKPLLNTFSTEKGIALVLTALLGLLNCL